MKTLSFLKAFYLFTLLLALIPITSCSNDDSSNSDSTNSSFLIDPIISIDPDNPFLFSATTNTNETIEFYGEKDTEGVPTKCDLIIVRESENTNPVLINLDDASRPKSVIGYDGSAITFNYDDPNDIKVNAIYPNNAFNLSFALNDNASKVSGLTTKTSASKRLGKKMKIVSNVMSSRDAVNSCADDTNVSVSLSKCGMPQGNPYAVRLHVLTDEPNTHQPFFPLGYKSAGANGAFCFRVRQGNWVLDTDALQNICSGFASVASVVCSGIEAINANPGSEIQLCATIAAASNLASVPAFVGCEALINALKIPCLAASSAVPGSNSVVDGICNSSILELLPYPSTVYFRPTVMRPGKTQYWGERTASFPIEGPFNTIDVMLPAEPEVSSFYTTPFDPNPDTDYLATAEIECLDAATPATITVVGTDGYTDSLSITLPEGSSTISLSVPGAEGGILDKITVAFDNITSSRVVIF